MKIKFVAATALVLMCLSASAQAQTFAGRILGTVTDTSGHGRRFGSKAPGAAQWFLGGWEVSAISTYRSGTPLGISAANTAGIFNITTRANTNGRSARLSGPVEGRLNKYFDASVFSQPAPFTLGNAGPREPDLLTPGLKNWDMALLKDFRVKEKATVQFRAEAFNASNTPRFGAPNTSVTSASFGVITSQANTPRDVQFSLKVLW